MHYLCPSSPSSIARLLQLPDLLLIPFIPDFEAETPDFIPQTVGSRKILARTDFFSLPEKLCDLRRKILLLLGETTEGMLDDPLKFSDFGFGLRIYLFLIPCPGHGIEHQGECRRRIQITLHRFHELPYPFPRPCLSFLLSSTPFPHPFRNFPPCFVRILKSLPRELELRAVMDGEEVVPEIEGG